LPNRADTQRLRGKTVRPIVPVILSGGSGTRLWPLSRAVHPKQFHALVDESTLFEQTLQRAGSIPAATPPMVICNEAHLGLVSAQLGERGGTIVLEPRGRNTAPAVAAAALLALDSLAADGDCLLLVLPADHVVEDSAAFGRAVEAGIDAADRGYLVTFGVTPTHAETGYGYLRCGAGSGTWFELERFVEKPDYEQARAYIDSGEYLWNSGMFLLSARLYLAELERHAPEMLACVREAVKLREPIKQGIRLGTAFGECPADSIDYAVMEKTDKAAAVPLDAGWSDVGSWPALHDVLESDEAGNTLTGNVVVEHARNNLVIADKRLIGIVGLDDIVVVDTDDALLVMSKAEAQRLKQLVEKIDSKRK
jgi:mannose-1-phosphate guanylyltransferase/mannose-6-phosphate isomerase